jgi:hypothetical protein
MPFSGMWRRVVILCTDISEVRIASIFMVEKSREQGTSATSQKTAFFISHRRENLKSYILNQTQRYQDNGLITS